MGGHGYSSPLVYLLPEAVPRPTGIVVCWFVTRGRAAASGYSSLLVCYPRRAWAATGIVVCWSVCYPRRVGGHGYSSLLVPQHCVYSMDSLHTTIS